MSKKNDTKQTEQKIKDFSDLLDGLKNTKDKKKLLHSYLWVQFPGD